MFNVVEAFVIGFILGIVGTIALELFLKIMWE